LPLGILTAAVLFANEIPDFAEDSLSGKRNLSPAVGMHA